MVSVWYPTRRHTSAPFAAYMPPFPPFAPYMPPRSAEAAAAQLMPLPGLWPEQVDFAGALTHARVGVPVLGRHHPVVLYSPGRRVSRLSGAHQVEELASRGYVVVAIDHTGESVVELPGGRILPRSGCRGRNTLDQLAVLPRDGNPDAAHRTLPAGLGDAG